MSKKPETKFKEKVMPLLRELPFSWWEKIQQKSINGTPDILGCVRGTFVAIELKKDEDAYIAELQLYKLNKISKAGGIALIVYPENWVRTHSLLVKLSKGGEDVV